MDRNYLIIPIQIFYPISVSTTDLLQFNELRTLEIRSSGMNRNLALFIDETMPMIKHAYFDSIRIFGDEKIKKRINYQHPSETYDYVPEGERFSYNIADSKDIVDEVEIVRYDVYKMKLSKAMRPNFYGWEVLEVLRIHNCLLEDVEWKMFAGLKNLQHLSLQQNHIKFIPPFAFYGAMHLKTLSLAYNDIFDLHYLALAGLLDLEHLDLTSNKLTKLSEITFPPFPNLHSIDLQNNPIEFILPFTFAIMNKTKELILGANAAAIDLSNINGAFVSLGELKSLNIVNAKSFKLHQTMFEGLKLVERLKIKGCVERIEYDAFSEMPQLKELYLSDCNIVDISMDAFFGIKDLRVIDLSHNKLSEIPLGVFDGQRQVKEIYLQHNNLKSLPKFIFSIKSLRLLRLTDNPWECSCEMADWNQQVTNSIRLNQKTSITDENCIRNPKSGKIMYCNDKFDNFPEFIYGFDNKMSPLCNDTSNSIPTPKNVYYILRHSTKCSQSAEKSNKKTMEQQRFDSKLLVTMEKMARKNKYNNNKFKLIPAENDDNDIVGNNVA